MNDQEESVSPPHGSLDDTVTPPSTSDGIDVKEERSRDLMDTRTTSTTTLHRLDISPAPSSVPTARRSETSSRSEELRFRVLCPNALVGPMIGRKGENIKRLRKQTNAEFVIEDYVLGCDDRVLSIILHRDSPQHAKTSGGIALVAAFDCLCEFKHTDELKTTTMSGSGTTVVEVAEAATATTGSDGDAQMTSSTVHIPDEDEEFDVRLLIDASQIGFVVGKSGTAIKNIQVQTGTAIKVLPKSELPACAWVSDEVLKISGPCQAVHAALTEVAKVLERHPPRHRPGSRQGPMLLAQASTGDAHFMGPTAHTLLGHHGLVASHAGSLLAGHAIETVFRLLAPVAKVGNIIGRNGDHVRKVRLETGARVKIYDGDEEAEERLVCVLSTEEVLSQYCAAQDALVRCAMCLNQPEEGQHRVRLLVPQTAIGAVLGKKGQTIMQLRQETGAAIRVHPTDAPIAACAASAHGGGEPGGDEIIQIDGSLPQTIAALRGVATLLRGWQIRRALTAPPVRSTAPQQPLTTPLVTLAGAPPASAVATLCHPPGSIVAIPIHSQPLPMQMQMQMQMPLQVPLAIHHQQFHGGLYGAAQHPPGVNMNMNVTGGGGGGGVNSASAGQMLWRYRLTNVQAGAVIGKAGHHVTQIRVLTGARVHLPGDHNQFGQSSSTDGLRTLEISGSLEACQAAHSLVNQFLALGQCAPAMPELLSGTSAGLSSSNLGSPRDPQQPPTYVVA